MSLCRTAAATGPAPAAPPCRLQGVATNCFPASGSCNALYDGYCTLGKLLNTSAALAGPWAGSLAKLAAGYCPAVDVQQVLNAGN